ALAIETLLDRGALAARPTLLEVAATSVGIVVGRPMLDLAYEEDSTAEVDFNVVMTGGGDFVEIQGTAERGAFSRAMSGRLLDLAAAGVDELIRLQREAVTSGRES